MSFSLRWQRLHNGDMLCLSTRLFTIAHILPYQIISICDICASEIHLASQKMLDTIGWRSLIESHLLTYRTVFAAWEVSAFLYSLCVYVLKVAYKAIVLGGCRM